MSACLNCSRTAMPEAGLPQAPRWRKTAFRNSSMQAAYLIFACRALGLDTGPMSGFDREKVDAAFSRARCLKAIC